MESSSATEDPKIIDRADKTLATSSLECPKGAILPFGRTVVDPATETAGDWTLLVPEGGGAIAAPLQGTASSSARSTPSAASGLHPSQRSPDLERRPALQTLREASAHAWVDAGAFPAFDMIEDEMPARDPNAGLAFSLDIAPGRLTVALKRLIGGIFNQFPFLFFANFKFKLIEAKMRR